MPMLKLGRLMLRLSAKPLPETSTSGTAPALPSALWRGRSQIDGLIFLFDADAEARSAHAAPFREAAARNFDQWYGSCTAFCSLARSIADRRFDIPLRCRC